MAIDYEEIDKELDEKMPSKYVFLPPMGAESTHVIVEMAKMQHDKLDIKYNQEKTQPDGAVATIKKSLGFYIGCTLESGQILVVNNIAVYRLFKDRGVKDGDTICVKHPGRGNYEVEILE